MKIMPDMIILFTFGLSIFNKSFDADKLKFQGLL